MPLRSDSVQLEVFHLGARSPSCAINRVRMLAGMLLRAATASAQDQEAPRAALPMAPPGPLIDDLMQWMVDE